MTLGDRIVEVLQTTPPRRLDVDERDAQLEDALAVRSRHTGTIRRFSWPRAASDEDGDRRGPRRGITLIADTTEVA